MKTALSCVALLGLSVVLSGQVGAPGQPVTQPDTPAATRATLSAKQTVYTANSTTLPDGRLGGDMALTATSVSIQIGTAVLSADYAVVKRGRSGELDEVQLKGDVRLKTALTLK